MPNSQMEHLENRRCSSQYNYTSQEQPHYGQECVVKQMADLSAKFEGFL
jgi:hypothetical protein